MSNEVLPFINNEVVELLEEFDDDYLADVFRIWDYDAQDWCGNYPILFRFEKNDLILRNNAGEFSARTGSIDTIDSTGAMRETAEKKGVCWRRDSAWSGAIGMTSATHLILEYVARWGCGVPSMDNVAL